MLRARRLLQLTEEKASRIGVSARGLVPSITAAQPVLGWAAFFSGQSRILRTWCQGGVRFQNKGDRVNTNGGAIALGHPIGASGARLAVHLAHQLAQGQAQRVLATLCVGGGMGAAVALEAV